jgi:Tol biopolymer transport system component
VISPDGRFVATVTDNAGKDAVALRQLSTAKDLQLAPPASEHYRGLSFSPDGDYLYYLKEEGNTAALFRVSVLGGTPTQVADNVGSRVTFSPDGRRLAFVRIYVSTGTDELVTANLDGTEQTIAAKSPLPDHFQGIGFFSSGPAWSPDGKLIVCITKRNDRATAQLFAVKLQDGSAVRIDTQDWFEIERIAWLADGTALLIQAKDQQKSNFQLWLLTYPDGKAQRITNDPNRYINLSATRDSGTLLATTSSQVASVWTVTPGKSGSGVKVPFSDYIGSGGISWTPDGRLVYSSRESGESSIWIMNLDGSQRRQLTFKQNDSNAAVSPDGRYVVFVRVGATRQLWRMRLDGSEQRPLAEHALGDYPRFSPDGKWVIYRTALAGAYLRRVSIDGGEPEDLIQQMATQPDVSPDGKSIACFAQEAQDKSPWLLAVFSASGTMQKSFALPKGVFLPSGLRWTPSGDALTFVVTNDGVSNIWRQPVNGDLAKQLTDFKNDRILQFAWSADGRLAIVRSADQNDLFLITDFR